MAGSYDDCMFGFFFFFFFRATPVAYGRSQAMGLIGAIATSLCQDPGRICDLYHSSLQCRIRDPLSEAREGTRNLMVPSRIRFCCTTMGTPLP